MFFIRTVLSLKQNCLKGIDFPGSPCPHTSQPPVLSASYGAMVHLLPTPPQPGGPAWTKHVISWPIVDIRRSLGVGRVVGLELYIMTCVHHTEWFVASLISPIRLESYFTLCECTLLWVSCRWGYSTGVHVSEEAGMCQVPGTGVKGRCRSWELKLGPLQEQNRALDC